MMKRLLACLLAVACLLMGFALAEGEALNMRVVKCTERVNIREYPTTKATIVGKAPLGAELVGCQQSKWDPTWYAVVYNGTAGYIRGDFLEVIDGAAPAKEAEPAKEEEPAKVEEPAKEAEPEKKEEPAKEAEPEQKEEPVEEVPEPTPAPDAPSDQVEERDPADDPIPEGEPELAIDDQPVVVDEPLAEEAPAEEAPAEEEPVEEAPAEEAPVEEEPAEEEPVEEAPAAPAIVLPAVENAPIAAITDAPLGETDNVILDADTASGHIVARRIYNGEREYLAVAALDADGNQLWMQQTATSGITELHLTDAFIGGIAARPLVMLYNAEVGLAAIDASNGNVRWLLSKDALALGAELSHAVVPGSGIMYIGGYYGPDPVAIDANGSVLWQASSGSDDIYWLESIELTSDGLACVYGNMDEQGNSGTVIYDYNGAVKEIVNG